MALNQPTPISHRYLTAYMLDVSNAENAYVAVPWKSRLVKLGIVIGNALTVANSVVTCSTVAADGTETAITGGAITVVQSGSAQGSEFTATPTVVTYLLEGTALKFASNGGSTGVAPSTCYAIVELMDN